MKYSIALVVALLLAGCAPIYIVDPYAGYSYGYRAYPPVTRVPGAPVWQTPYGPACPPGMVPLWDYRYGRGYSGCGR